MKQITFIFILLTFSFSVVATNFIVVNTNDSGSGSLREAITLANVSSGGTNNIIFNIPISDGGYNSQTGVWTISLTSPLDYIMKAGIVIDGTTQTTFAGNTNTLGPGIMLNGNGTVDYGFFVLNVPDVVIKSFIISDFIYGIQVTGNAATNTIIKSNYIGVNYDASDSLPNYIGIEISGESYANIIGGTEPDDRNIISGNSHIGLRLLSSNSNIIKGNFVGLDRTGNIAVKNYDGISLEGVTQNNIIGGYTPAERNIVSGNDAYGIPLIGLDTRHNLIIGNYIGTNAQGTAAVPNTYGVLFDDGSRYNNIGGYETGAGNLISGNSGYGVFIYNLGTMQNNVIGNYIGTDKTGLSAIPNGNGIVADGAAKNHFIDSNVISGNLQQGIAIHVAGTDSHKITRNKIGTDVTGINPLPNGDDGIRIAEGGQWNIIGILPDSGNVIAFNGGNGVTIMTNNDLYNTISGNNIYANVGLGIDLYYPGPNINDPGDTDSGPNMDMNYPVIQNAVYNQITGITTVSGILDTQKPQTTKVELFLSDNYPCGYGQGKTYLCTATPLSDGSFSISFNHTLTLSNVCATATDSTGNTSEFSLNYNLPPPASIFDGFQKPFSLNIFPNPTADYIHLNFDTQFLNTDLGCEIYDAMLNLVTQFNIVNNNYIVDCKTLNSGQYYVIIKDKRNSTIALKRFIVIKGE